VYRAAGEKPPPRREAPAARPAAARSAGAGDRPEADAPAWPETAALDRLWERAAGQSAGWQTLVLRPPRRAGDTLAVTIREAGARAYQRSTLTLDSATAEVEKWEPFAASTTGRRARVLLRFLHTGEALGLPGQVVAGIASLGATLLVYTGLSLALRRFAAWLRTRFRTGERGRIRPLVETPEDGASRTAGPTASSAGRARRS
jgi:uncharacterized iron-regulated membrane protein